MKTEKHIKIKEKKSNKTEIEFSTIPKLETINFLDFLNLSDWCLMTSIV